MPNPGMMPDGAQATWLVVGHGLRVAVNIFGELVEPEDGSRRSSPVRIIPVDAALRAHDARERRQREQAAVSPWRVKTELRAENLQAVKPSVVKPGRKDRPPETQPVMKVSGAQLHIRKTGRPPVVRMCAWCREAYTGWEAHRKHLSHCRPKAKQGITLHTGANGRPRVLLPCKWCGEGIIGWLEHRRHENHCAMKPKPPRVPNPPCANSCGRLLPMAARFRRTDGLCGTCGRTAS